jgi:hypothetical protein
MAAFFLVNSARHFARGLSGTYPTRSACSYVFMRWLMLFVFIAITHLFKPKQCSSQAPVGSEERLAVSAIAPSPSVKSYRHAILRFDFRLAFVSLLLYAIAYVGITLAPTGYLFTVASVFTSLGGGFGPTSQSMLLELHSLRVGTHDAQAGAVLGSLGVLAALVGQVRPCFLPRLSDTDEETSKVLGPAMLGIVYFKTVARLPQASLAIPYFHDQR